MYHRAIGDLHVAGGAAVDLVHVGHQLDALAHDEEEHHQYQHTVHVLLLPRGIRKRVSLALPVSASGSCSPPAQG